MTNKKIVFSNEARIQLSNGVQMLSDAVGATLGPRGRTALIENIGGLPSVTKDGYTVTKSIQVEDPIENMGIQLIKQVAQKVVDEVGDNTTTSTVLANAIFQKGLEALESGVNPIQLQKGMNAAVKEIISVLIENSRQITDIKDIQNIATISCNNDAHMGEMIAKCIEEIGAHGTINVQKSDLPTDSLEIVHGMSFNRTYHSPYFVTNPSKLEVEYDSPAILLTTEKIRTITSIIPVLEFIQKEGKPLIIIGDVEGDALQALVANKVKKIIQVATLPAPGIGDRSVEMLKDIAILTGATLVNSEMGNHLSDINPEWLGEADSIKIDKMNTTFINNNVNEEAVMERVTELQALVEVMTAPYDKEKTMERIAKLIGGVAVIKVGGYSEAEILERKDRFDDGVAATKAAQEEGIIIGGGAAFIHAACKLNEMECDEQIGFDLIIDAIYSPFVKIMENSGFSLQTIDNHLDDIEKKSSTIGYNVLTNMYEDLFDSGIIDSLKGARISLEAANSAASTLLTTETVVYYAASK